MLHVRWIVPIAILSIGGRLEAQEAPKAIAAQVPVAPTIDGRLDDGAWAGAEVLTDFVQREPMEGRPVSERTEVRLVYDDAALYVGAWMFDVDPSSFVVGQTLRDASVNDSDAFLMVIDTYLDLRVCLSHGGGYTCFGIGRMDWGWRVRPEARVNI